MSFNTNDFNWENKPKLSHKWLSFFYLITSCLIFYFSYTYLIQVYEKHTKAEKSSIDMQALSKDLVNLEIAPLEPIEVNQQKLDFLYNFGFGDIEIKYPETEQDKPFLPSSDNIGNFYRVEVIFFGDMYEQLYFLSKFDKLRNFLMIDSMNANSRNIIIKARLYGQ